MTVEGATVISTGDLARQCGVSVRTLRYYDQIGLLKPTRRGPGGQRFYDGTDVRRLYRIRLLRRVGLTLAEIGRALDEPGWPLHSAMRTHLEMLDQRLAAGLASRQRLERMVSAPSTAEAPPTAELIAMMEEMTLLNDTVQRRISMLAYDDVAAMQSYLVRVFGLGEGPVSHDADGSCVQAEVRAGDGVIWLHQGQPELGLLSPSRAGGATGTTAVVVDDVDAHHRHAVEQQADVLYPPVDQPFGVREYSARDPEGGLWSFMNPMD